MVALGKVIALGKRAKKEMMFCTLGSMNSIWLQPDRNIGT